MVNCAFLCLHIHTYMHHYTYVYASITIFIGFRELDLNPLSVQASSLSVTLHCIVSDIQRIYIYSIRVECIVYVGVGDEYIEVCVRLLG